MADKNKYRTVSIPTGITNEIEHLIKKLRYWLSVSSFVREVTLEKIKVERRHLRESKETEKSPIRGAGMPQA